jgi:hypothetical protein
MLFCVMVWPSSAQGNRPYARPTRQAVYIVVTPSPENSIFCPLCFQSLAHSFGASFFTTPLQSVRSALFTENTGGGYTPQESPHVFKLLRTLQDSDCPKLARRSSLARSCTRQAAEAGRPVDVPLDLRCFPTENAVYLFSLHTVVRVFRTQRGGVHPTPVDQAKKGS